jgi:hypothetical protein
LQKKREKEEEENEKKKRSVKKCKIDNKMKNKLIARNKTCNKNYRNKFVIALVVFVLCIQREIACSSGGGDEENSLEAEIPHKNNFVEKCEQRCKDQVNNQSEIN